MMKLFVSKHVILLILVVTTTIDASRLFYLPLPKIHPTHQQQQQQEEIKPLDETTKKPISDEFIPKSVLEQEEIEKRGDTFDWEELIDQEAAKRRSSFDEIPSDINEQLFEDPWIVEKAIERVERLQSNPELNLNDNPKRRNESLFMLIVGACGAVGVVGLLGAATFWYKIKKQAKPAEDSEYPSYGVTGPNTTSGGKMSPSSTMSDRKLAQSAQMFHYQQQRQQIMAQEKAHLDAKPGHSDDSDDEAPAGGDYTVYECPGLAPTGEMEVRNPLFTEPDSSLLSSPTGSYPPSNTNFPQLTTSPTKEKSIP